MRPQSCDGVVLSNDWDDGAPCRMTAWVLKRNPCTKLVGAGLAVCWYCLKDYPNRFAKGIWII